MSDEKKDDNLEKLLSKALEKDEEEKEKNEDVEALEVEDDGLLDKNNFSFKWTANIYRRWNKSIISWLFNECYSK